jgi:cell division protein FtsI/penicillin-binding protein 2
MRKAVWPRTSTPNRRDLPRRTASYLASDRGYTREDLVGKEGIERAYEPTLRALTARAGLPSTPITTS